MLQVRCSVNPLIGRETRFPGGEADRTRRVVVVGGGPAGLEASRTAAARGHAVTLVEREYELGGIFRLASHSELKAELKKYLDWSIRSVMSHPMIDVQLGLEAEPGLIAALNPEVVIIAAGAEPILPKFSASGTRKIVWAGDVERDASLAGDDVVIAGAGVTGLELALTLTNLGKRVRVIDMLPREKIGQGGTAINMIALNQLLERNNVEIIPSVRLSDVTEDGAIIARGDDTETLTCDTVILSFGFRPNSAKLREFESVAETVLYIGDCAATTGGTLRNAVRQGFDAAMMIK
jgi:NADPH-dependent 2,4-dienoyl-CoA reductase/sulfur reductase-like enzyme